MADVVRNSDMGNVSAKKSPTLEDIRAARHGRIFASLNSWLFLLELTF